MKNSLILSVCFFLLLLAVSPAWAETAENPVRMTERGREFYQKGDAEHAALSWEQALTHLDPETETGIYLDTVAHLGNAYQSLGYHQRALPILLQALPVAEKSEDHYHNAIFYNTLSDLYFSLGKMMKVIEYLPKAVEEASKAEDPRILARVLVNVGNAFSAEKDYKRALSFYGQCFELAEESDDSELGAMVSMNIARAELMGDDHDGIGDALDYTRVMIENMPDCHGKVKYLISLSMLILEVKKRLNLADPDLTLAAFQILDDAKKIAENLEDFRMTAYACGYMGQLYEEEGRYEEALRLTRRALFFAQQGNFPQILYLWQWQLGRLFKAKGEPGKAIRAYQNAISTLNPIRQQLFIGYRSRGDFFNKRVKPVYTGLTELLLKQAETIKDEKARQSKLLEARDTMEILKTAELEDFFKDECVTIMQAEKTTLENSPPGTAVIYPISLPETLAVLLTLPDGIRYISIPVDSGQVTKTITKYRMRLQTRPNKRFLYDSQQLYDWLIRPVEPELNARKIDTLVFAPDGVLRLIPFSTLHDGKCFLVEKYAIGTIPAISLTDIRPVAEKENLSILLGGLSEARQGFSPLPGVSPELQDIKKIMDGRVLIQNKDYTVENLTREFKAGEYSLVHIATHGVFGGTPDESFLLTYDSKMNMNLLERLIGISKYRTKKVELLTLSACQTALGNERAAMGLAGVAVKAGVKSAIATLWFVDDEATSLATREFYREFKKPGISKAKAMQNVQKKLISQKRYWHPLYWAPFLVIGNWM